MGGAGTIVVIREIVDAFEEVQRRFADIRVAGVQASLLPMAGVALTRLPEPPSDNATVSSLRDRRRAWTSVQLENAFVELPASVETRNFTMLRSAVSQRTVTVNAVERVVLDAQSVIDVSNVIANNRNGKAGSGGGHGGNGGASTIGGQFSAGGYDDATLPDVGTAGVAANANVTAPPGKGGGLVSLRANGKTSGISFSFLFFSLCVC